jgi:hypothetical protein
MCWNACGLGAVNIFWLVYGLFLTVVKLATLDCASMVASFVGGTHECTSLEKFLTIMWGLTGAGWGVTLMFLAYLPKFLASGYPGSANKGVLRVITITYILFQLFMLLPITRTTLELDSGSFSAGSPATLGGVIVPLCLLAVAICVHRDPTTGAGMF